MVTPNFIDTLSYTRIRFSFKYKLQRNIQGSNGTNENFYGDM